MILLMFSVITFRIRRSRDEMTVLVTAVCVSVCLSVCLSLNAFPHYCTDLNVTWGMVGVPLVVDYWADLQSVHGFRCYDNIAPNTEMSATACRLVLGSGKRPHLFYLLRVTI